MPTEASSTIATDATAGEAPLTLGEGMSRRARSQSVFASHRMSATLIGAVGRASVGFGLAIGRSRAIRPNVNLSEVNTAALRPPTNFWREPISEPPVDESMFVPANPSAASASTASPARSDRSMSRSAAPPRSAARSTWTDQVIQRSAVGHVSAPQGAVARSVPVPDDFVPTGDAKLDRLRLLLRAREGDAAASAVQRSPSSPARRRTPAQPSASEAAASHSSSGQPAVGSRRGDTAAGASTGPGLFARSMRPEPVVRSSAATVGSPPAPGSSSTAGPPSSGRSGQSVRRSRAEQAQPAPSKMETLRQLLIEKGLMPGETAGGDALADAETRSAPGAASHRAEPGRGDNANSDNQRGVEARPDGSSIRRTPAGGSTSASTQGRTSSTSSALSDAATRSKPADSTSTPPGGVAGSTIAPEHATRPSVGADTAPRAAWPDAPLDSSAMSVASRRAAATRLRAGRTLSSGLVAGAVSGDAASTFSTTTKDSAALATLVATGRTGGTAVGSAPVVRPALPWPQTRPSLPLVSNVAVSTIRRVTLPRAMSSAHRPHTTFSAAAPTGARPDTGRDEVPFDVIGSSPVSMRVSARRTIDRQGVVLPAISQPTFADLGVARTGAGRPVGIRRATHRRSAGRAWTSQGTIGQPTIGQPTIGRPAIGRPASGQPAIGQPKIGQPPTRQPESVRPATMQRMADRRSIDERAGAHPVGRTAPADASTARRGAASTRTDFPTQRASTPRRTIGRSVLPAGVGALHAIIRRHPGDVQQAIGARGVAGSPGDVRTRSATSPAATDQDVGATESPTVGPPTVGPPVIHAADVAAAQQRPAERLAEQFMTELSRTVRRSSAPLPMPFRPMADQITGGRRVMLSTDGASRRALRSVGKVAATTGDTIHLDRSAIPQRRLDEVVAHELTHVAHPSPAPRFFDDIDDSPEERRAEQVASIMARSPLAPSAPIAAPRSGAGGSTVRRSPAAPGAPSSAVVSADALAARLGGAVSAVDARSSDVIRRFASGSSNSSSSTSTWQSATPSSRTPGAPKLASTRQSSSSGPPAPMATPIKSAPSFTFASEAVAIDWFRTQVRENLGMVLNLIEDQMVIELERRGGRSWGGL